MFGKLLLAIMLVANCLVGANHIEFYKIQFATGRYSVNQNIQTQIAKVFKLLPEQGFSRLHMRGEAEESYLPNIAYLLAKRRSESVSKYLLDAGLPEGYVKVNYSSVPHLLVFKEKTKKIVDEVADVDKVEKSCTCANIEASTSNSIITAQGNIITIPSNAFESEIGIPISKGLIRFCYNEIDFKEALYLGWHSVKEGALFKDFYSLYSEATFNGKPLRIQKYARITVNKAGVPESGNSGYLTSGYGQFKNETWVWGKDVRTPFFSASEQPILDRYNGEVFRHGKISLDVMGFTILEIEQVGYARLSYKAYDFSHQEKDVMNTGNERLILRVIYPEAGIVIPIYRDNNFNNLFHTQIPEIEEEGWVLMTGIEYDGCWKSTASSIVYRSSDKPLLIIESLYDGVCW